MKGSASRAARQFPLGRWRRKAETALLAKRLDLALNNMSHGLLMIDGKGRVTVVNRQLLNLFRLGADDVRSGASLRAVARKLMRRRIVAQGEIERVWKTLARAAAGLDGVAPFETRDDRAIEVTVHRMTGEGEGAVVVVQDVTERRNAARAIDRLARVDSVTDLPNRRRFEEELADDLARARRRAAKRQRPVSRSRRFQAGQRQSRPRARRQAAGGGRAPAAGDRPRRPTSSRAGAATNSRSCSARSPALEQAAALAEQILREIHRASVHRRL